MQLEPRNKQPLDAGFEGLVDHVGLDHQVVVDEIGRIGVVGVDSADPGRGQDDKVRLLGLHEITHGGLVGQIQLGMRARDQLERIALLPPRFESPHNGAADHPAMAGDVDFLHEMLLYSTGR